MRINLADTGCGMDRGTLRRLFEPFVSTKGDSGTGLGLWVSREILDKHHATIRVRSRQRPGESGTVFSIWVPETMAGDSGDPPGRRKVPSKQVDGTDQCALRLNSVAKIGKFRSTKNMVFDDFGGLRRSPTGL
jgi:hypothetical protein